MYLYFCGGQVLYDQLLQNSPRHGNEQGYVVERCDVSSLPTFFFSNMERKVVLVTGASKGIGLAISHFLHQKNIIVYGTSRTVANGELLNGIPMLRLDMAKKESIHQAIDFLIQKEGRIDVLVNNAGTGISGAIEDTTLSEYQSYFNTHVFGMMECCQAVIPQMRKQSQGQIINISSIAGVFGLPFRGVYSASKSAVNRLSETLRMELAPWNVFVSIVQPGDFKTDINSKRIIPTKSASKDSLYYTAFSKQYDRISKEVSEGRNPEEIAKVIWKIVQSRKPKLRYTVGTFEQKLAVLASRLLPTSWFQKILSNRYPVK